MVISKVAGTVLNRFSISYAMWIAVISLVRCGTHYYKSENCIQYFSSFINWDSVWLNLYNHYRVKLQSTGSQYTATQNLLGWKCTAVEDYCITLLFFSPPPIPLTNLHTVNVTQKHVWLFYFQVFLIIANNMHVIYSNNIKMLKMMSELNMHALILPETLCFIGFTCSVALILATVSWYQHNYCFSQAIRCKGQCLNYEQRVLGFCQVVLRHFFNGDTEKVPIACEFSTMYYYL